MTRLELHAMTGSKRAGHLARLVADLFRDGRRVVVWIEDDGLRQAFDDYLWTYSKLAFLPHAMWSASMGEIDDPVVLVGEMTNPNGAEVLVIGDEMPAGDWVAAFAEVHDLIPEDESGEARTGRWNDWRREHHQGGDG